MITGVSVDCVLYQNKLSLNRWVNFQTDFEKTSVHGYFKRSETV